MIRRIIERMGLYKNEKIVVDYIANKAGIFTYPETPRAIASNTTGLDVIQAREALDLAIESEFVLRPEDKDGNYIPGEHLTVTDQGKRYLKRRFGVADQFIHSYQSANNFIAILALVFAVINIIATVLIALYVKSKT